MTTHEYNRLRKRVERAFGVKLPKAPGRKSGPDVTEQKFAATILGGMGDFVGNRRKDYGIAVTRSGIVYTPDFIYPGPVIDGKSRLVVCEVKLKKYRSPKDERLIKSESRTKWEMAGDLHPEYDFAWAEYAKGGAWEIEVRFGDTFDRAKGVCRSRAEFDALLRGNAAVSGGAQGGEVALKRERMAK